MKRVSPIFNDQIKPRLAGAGLVVIGGLGFFLRLFHFGVNRSLWLDEAALALNIVNRSFTSLFSPLDFNQGTPLGFLLMEKAAAVLLGDKDFVLRLVPLLAGLACIPLMYLVARKIGGRSFTLLSLVLLVLSPRLIYYASEVKQYSSDAAVALILLLVVPECLLEEVRLRSLVKLCVAGCLTLWLSHPALFVFAGILVALSLKFILRKDWRRLAWLAGIGAVWGLNLGVLYLINLRYLEANKTLLDYWVYGFAPLPPWSNLDWYSNALTSMLADPAVLPANLITLSVLFIGVVSLALRTWQWTLVLVLPFFFTMLASAFEKYPFNGRLLVFLLPLLLLLLAEGVECIRHVVLKANRAVAWLVYAVLFIFLAWEMTGVNLKNLQNPPLGEHIKPPLAHIAANRLSGDLIYVYYGAEPAFRFYAPQYGLSQDVFVVGVSSRKNPGRYLAEIEALKGRVWFVFAHNCDWCLVNERKFFLDNLDRVGHKADESLAEGAAVYLYDLGQSP